MRDFFKKFTPGFLKPILRNIYVQMLDLMDWLRGRDSMLPPRSMIFVGGGDFVAIGQEFKNYFIDLAGMQPYHRVLEVGCGIGRMAIPLTGYLSSEGAYFGFDAVTKGINWCSKHISSKYGNFHFLHCDIYNKLYNKNGKIPAKDYQFPYDNGSFDFIFLTSVFTHMLPADVEHYMGEISRVLKIGGKCLITFYILNAESQNLIHAGRSNLDFRYKLNDCLTIDENEPETAIAYEQEYTRKLFGKCGLSINEPVYYGSWCKREKYLSYQDIIIASKEKMN
jgi:SAM-dependent methyltransferase